MLFRIRRTLWYTWIKDFQPRLAHGPIPASDLPIDVLIPSIDKDYDMLPYMIDGIRSCIQHPICQILIVAPESAAIKSICADHDAAFVNEATVLPIRKNDIDYCVQGLDRSGWLFQQFLKLSGDKLCQQRHYLVVDSDTVFIRPQSFERQGKTILSCNYEYYRPYFTIYRKLLNESTDLPLSLTSHHMLFDQVRLQALKHRIEAVNKCTWYEAIIKHLDKNEKSAHSDYETYGQFVYKHYREEVLLEYWANLSLPRHMLNLLPELKANYGAKYKTVSFHHWNKHRDVLIG